MSFSVDEFDRIVSQIEAFTRANAKINPADFYPAVKQHKGKSRDLPMVDAELREALTDYLSVRLERDPMAKLSDPLFITQKGYPYSPKTLQEHMALPLTLLALSNRRKALLAYCEPRSE